MSCLLPHRRIVLGLALGLLTCCAARAALAETLPLPPDDVDLVGQTHVIKALYEDTLLDIARRSHLGHDEILIANPTVDKWLPGAGTPITLPTRYILPAADRTGIVLNVPEMRVYYFPPAKRGEPRVIKTYPVSVGRQDWSTPIIGNIRVAAKVKDPAWHPPKSIRAEAAARGEIIPEVVPPGPKNPLGQYALRLSIPGYLIHGTDKPWGIGMRVTHGCLRLYPEDSATIFHEVSVGTPVHIVNQPVKVGWVEGMLYMEVHPPLEEDLARKNTLMNIALDVLDKALTKRRTAVSGRAITEAVAQQSGMPVPISRNAILEADAR
ncbi:MAG: L,D-transpeptidase family protein [Gammaproteobacteria bacterium]|nr:L,D-transpeptidase family protein [Gammaproteobacteria bacterium]